MYSTLICLALITATAAPGVLASFVINVPQLTQCQEIRITWSEGTPPYYLVAVDPEDPCGEPIIDFGAFNSTVCTWDTALPEHKKIQFYVEDSGEENEAWSKSLTVGASNDASCLSQYNNTTSPSTASYASATSSSTPPYSSPPDNSGLVPVGAANAGTNPLGSGASSMRQGTSTVLLVAAFAAAIAPAL
ncbi:hypothetical protein AX14_012606 [Amanita brunnescens Koide BX004]|nr:hypothetical protein AX14_012606 [Amanita brunnescens Koide BX004]